MEEQEIITINKETIPLIMKAVNSNGNLPKTSVNSPILLKKLLYIANDDMVYMTIRQMSDLMGLGATYVTRYVKILEKYKFIKNMTPEKEAASIWQINIDKLNIALNAYLKAKKLKGKKIVIKKS